ncbi:hypothetical protein AC578_7190 [Pseudocercospora eumusae]|uniref:Uncharacterized protein n=1 Tax=Pseudocercospora eumusae TaxID=321146 RepID=A0A139HWP9_9PEZI|nr:hypothetical protein AC578_7190 [Pseudocercospora eumusae]KXT06893.1 hypothetical protein AC578_7190 [Pseudocercospora eumusae]KXT06895.1 hypothetical protein AC578_7190 [Pseudocercospora eumusae]
MSNSTTASSLPTATSISTSAMATTSTDAAPVTSTTEAAQSSSESSILSSITSSVSSDIISPTTTTQPPKTTSEAPVSTSTLSLSSVPPTTQVITSVVTQSPTNPTESNTPVTVVVTRTNSASQSPITTQSTSSTGSATSSQAALNTGGGSSGSGSGSGGGLSTAGVTAIAVVVPVVVVALLVLAGIFLWRKRKQKKAAEEARRKEVEDYGFNPNNDPTLPTVVSESGHEMSEDNSGYRGWGAAGASTRKMSTTLSGGHTQGQLSDSGSNPYGGHSPSGGISEQSGDPLMHQRRETMNSDVGSLGQGPIAGAGTQGGMKRGPSNASSTYTTGAHSDVSAEMPPPGSMPSSYDAYNPAAGYGYSQHGPYGDGSYGGTGGQDGMPVVQDVSARRNTRIQQPGNYQQGNSGIAQNF